MLLSSVQVQGFKSFAGRFKLSFSQGIAGMAGPAGCGRTNLIEAIRWALGEPSLTVLCASEPRDLTFAGTDKRRDMFQTTVSLAFSDCPEDWGLVDNKLRVTRQINDRTGTDLLTGQNGSLDAQTVAQLLALASTIGTGSPRNFGWVLSNFMSSTAFTRARSSRAFVFTPALPPTSRAGYP